MSNTATIDAPARLLVVEDEPKLAEILGTALRRQGYEVTIVTRGDDAERMLLDSDVRWSLVVLDRMLPGLDGVELCRRVRAAHLATPIILLTALESVEERVIGLDAGANDYLPKPFALKELYARIRALLRTAEPARARETAGSAADDEVLVVGDLRLDIDGRMASRAGVPIDLRPKEAAILAALMRRADRVVERWVILDEAWGDVDAPSTNHLDVHIGRLRHKVDRPFGAHSIETIRGIGYRIRANPS